MQTQNFCRKLQAQHRRCPFLTVSQRSLRNTGSAEPLRILARPEGRLAHNHPLPGATTDPLPGRWASQDLNRIPRQPPGTRQDNQSPLVSPQNCVLTTVNISPQQLTYVCFFKQLQQMVDTETEYISSTAISHFILTCWISKGRSCAFCHWV